MLVIANAGTFVGRLGPAAVAQWIGAMNTVIGLTLIVAIITFCWIAVHSTAGMVVWSFLWGAVAGGFSTVDPVVIMHPVMSPSTSVVGTRLGMAWLAAGIGVLIGTPIAGMLGGAGKGYVHAQIFGGAIMIGGLAFAVVPWWYILRADRAKAKEKEEKEEEEENGVSKTSP
jgi:MFS family permease